MITDDEIMSAEEFFGGIDNGEKKSSRAVRTHGKKKEEGLFSKMKVKMVMRIYDVSRAKALEIIAGREAAKTAKNGKAQDGGKKGDSDEELMSAEEFFA